MAKRQRRRRKPVGGRVLRKRRLRKKKFKHIVKMLLSDNPVTEWVNATGELKSYSVDFQNIYTLTR